MAAGVGQERAGPARIADAAVVLVPAVLALALALVVARPLVAAPLAFDAAASVLHFERLVAGVRLETFLSTTPKPLLTVVDGAARALAGDWRAVSLATIAAGTLGTALAALLALRLGGRAAAVATGVAVAGMPALLFDEALGLAVPWALACWAGAGLCLARPDPRYATAGVLLGLAVLARLEGLVVPAGAVALLVLLRLAPARPGLRPPRAAWGLALGLGALPVMALHDLLLAGDPLFWAGVARRYSETTALDVPTLREVAEGALERYAAQPLLVLLAGAGLGALARGAGRAVAAGIALLAGGIAALALLLAATGVFVPDRYLAGVDLALAPAAGVGLAALGRAAARRAGLPRGPLPAAAGLVAAALVGVLVVAGWGGDAGTRRVVDLHRELGRQADAALPAARAALRSPADPGTTLLVPVPVRPRLAVDLGLTLDRVGSYRPAAFTDAAPPLAPGTLVLHLGAAGSAPALEGAVPVAGLVTVASDSAAGWWLVRVVP